MTKEFIETEWDTNIVPKLEEFIRIPNQSPLFDTEWETNGHMDAAAKLVVDWIEAQEVEGISVRTIKHPERTPLVLCEIAPFKCDAKDTLFLYGHLDKQPPLTETWAEGLGPWSPVIKDGKLFGRGGADDGYAAFASIAAIRAVQRQGKPHRRIVVLIEASEESGSRDLFHYLTALKDDLGDISCIVCLDSGCGNYDQLWVTSSLRGIVVGDLRVEILNDGVHSGLASGIVPSSFRIIRQLLERVEDAHTGQVICPGVAQPDEDIPEFYRQSTRDAVADLGDLVHSAFPFVDGAQPFSSNNEQLLLNRTWRPIVSYTGIDGVPSLPTAGNVLRPNTTLKLSVRLAPNQNAADVRDALVKELTRDPPYGARVTFETQKASNGFLAPDLDPWLLETLDGASKEYFDGRPVRFMGEGGSIPFMGLLRDQFPEAQFVVTGVLGPASNAHGPNESLDIRQGKGVTFAVAHVIERHGAR